ncbi:MAG: translation initiation factor IF-2 [Candidatus Marinimicrobia bacterium]|nr:translation initiation factor IF-2 [Candidatus Neomarinimicrobiota bacterium]
MSTKTKEKKKRIFQIAKELNISHMEIIRFLKKEDIPCKGVNSAVDKDVYFKILEEFSEEKNIVERIKKEKARKKAEEKRQKEEEARKVAKRRQEKIETEILETVEDSFRNSIDDLYQVSYEKVKNIIPKKTKKKKSKKTQSKTKQKKSTKKKKKKLKKISREEIERKLGKKSSRKKRRKSKKKQIDSDKVDNAFKKTMAKIKSSGTKKKKGKKKKKQDTEETTDELRKIKISEYATVEKLANMMNEDPTDVVQKCVEMGMFVTINQRLDFDTISLIADEFGYEAEKQEEYGEEILQIEEEEDDPEKAEPRPPVVTVMGHVDHGKTTLLDRIRETNVVAGESGGITQHIGAYQVELDNGDNITFLDTPGHEAFTTMRARGAQATDIVVIIVAADDSVMPQTVEAIDHAKSAEVPIIIAINKMDRPQADAEKVRRELSEKGILVESWGGDIQEAEMSALEGEGIDDLLELILLEAEMLELKANPNKNAKGVVIEAKVDKRLGAIATVLIRKGNLKVGDCFVCGASYGRVRALYNERGNKIETVKPGEPTTVVGFDEVPKLADILFGVDDINEARKIANERKRIKREERHREEDQVVSLDMLSQQIAKGETKTLNVILKGDVDGSVEAISETLSTLGNEEVAVSIKHKSAGEITENDVMLAKASDAIIIGFNVSANPKVKEIAKRENIEIRRYRVIYELIEDVTDALEGMLSPEKVEIGTGVAEVRAVFKIPDIGKIAGSYVQEGNIYRNTMGRLKRDGKVIYESEINSLKRFKDDVREVQEGYECGINLEGFDEYEEGDIIEAYEVKNKKRSLDDK